MAIVHQNGEDPKWTITGRFAKWTVSSALRNPGSPLRRRDMIYDALYVVQFDVLFNRDLGPIGEEEFTEWHAGSIAVLQAFERGLSVGWAAKMVAI